MPLITPPLHVFLLFFLPANLTILIWPFNHSGAMGLKIDLINTACSDQGNINAEIVTHQIFKPQCGPSLLLCPPTLPPFTNPYTACVTLK